MSSRRMTNKLGILAAVATLFIMQNSLLKVSAQDDPVFSGPQIGEPLPTLEVSQPLQDEAGESVDAAAIDDEHPHRLVVFVHQITRPSIAFTRVLGQYAATRKDEGLLTSVVFLGSDATELAASVRRARGALPQNVTIGISKDGLEGPGAYGLNREVTLTVLLASEGKVTFNAALVDPSIPVELPTVLTAICELAGGQPPEVETLMQRQGTGPMMRGQAAGRRGEPATRGDQIPNDQIPGFSKIEPLLRMLIRKETSDDRVDELAKEIDANLKDRPEAKQRLKEIAGRVYKIYGTDQAKIHLRRWAGVKEDQVEKPNDSEGSTKDE